MRHQGIVVRTTAAVIIVVEESGKRKWGTGDDTQGRFRGLSYIEAASSGRRAVPMSRACALLRP